MTEGMEWFVASLFPNNFSLRVVSALVIAGPAFLAIHFGTPYFNVFIAFLAVLMSWEWSNLCQGQFNTGGIILALFSGAVPFLPVFGLEIIEGVLIAPVFCALLFALSSRQNGRVLFSLGAIYIVIPVTAFIFLRAQADVGLYFVYWLVLVVVATDTGGYAFGITIGGPKLAPKISPNKTWAGLLGGMASAFLVGLVISYLAHFNEMWLIALFSSFLALIAQIGDLFESHVKRRFGIKDSSNIIPGHGGVLDRVDGMLSAGAAFAATILVSNGMVLSWF